MSGTEPGGRPGEGLRLFMLDNYDSFTYNLVQYLRELGALVEIARNDETTPAEILDRQPDGVVVSPGPGHPGQAGITKALIERATGRVPLLGVCLGHQAMGEVFGAKVVRAARLMHGKTSPILHANDELHVGLENPFEATRYHSLLLQPDTVAPPLTVTAWTSEGEIMGIRHDCGTAWGVQYHPESILTGEGKRLLANFLARCRGAAARA